MRSLAPGVRLALLVALAVLASILAVALGVATLVPASHIPRVISSPRESCLTCHAGPEDDPGGLHPAATIGCEPCHLGNPQGLTAGAAHLGMEPEPGALRTAERTCGRCHQREHATVATSLMATGRGLIAVDQWAFGERDTPDGTDTFADLFARGDTSAPSPADDHLRRLCAGCHLGTTRDNRDDAITLGGSGCSACHAPARAVGPGRSSSTPAPRVAHPPIDSRVSDDRCLGCHSRSGRIALGYQGLYEMNAAAPDPACQDPVTLHDGRAGCRTTPDVHHAAGMACIDCHTRRELMGDGTRYPHEELATEVRCEHCHGPVPVGGEATWSAVTDLLTLDLLRQRRELRPPDEAVRIARHGTPLWNVRPSSVRPSNVRPTNQGWTLFGKLDGKAHLITPTPRDPDHQRPGHERLTCAACHDSTAPRCATCHTRYDPVGSQWDFGRGGGLGALASGAWLETNAGFGWAPPTLGVSPDGRIVPTMPGMIATLEVGSGARRELRLHAAIAPHRTQREARTCASCHADAVALGLGAGRLTQRGDTFVFEPTMPGALDAWTTLFPDAPSPTTRTGGRSLDAAEQRRVLTVGVCLTCHPAD